MKLKLVLSPAERTTIVAALIAYGNTPLASSINARVQDPADDGPEVEILRDPTFEYSNDPT